MALKIRRKNGLCFTKWHKEFANFHWLKNNNFILESKMAELNQNKNSQQLDRPDAAENFMLPWN